MFLRKNGTCHHIPTLQVALGNSAHLYRTVCCNVSLRMTSVTLLPPQDPQYIQQALTHVLLMDAVVGTLQTSNAIYAASKLSYFDKMKTESKTGTRVTAQCPARLPRAFRRGDAHP